MVGLAWDPVTVSVAIFLGGLVGYLLVALGRSIVRPAPKPLKLKNYACGEEPAPAHPDSEEFFSPVRRVLGPFYRYIRPAHKGIINIYLLWMVVGMLVIFVVLLLTVMK
ncbi:MAG: hypothetical protein ACK4GQ_03920 [Candidatus Hadarchaeales archaeon]